MQECVGVKACMMCSKVNEPELEDNDFFIGTSDHEGGDELLVDLVIQDSHTVTVKLDTGAQVNVMPLTVYKALGKDPKKLKPTNTNFSVVVISSPGIRIEFAY